jgi:hypothetical protein
VPWTLWGAGFNAARYACQPELYAVSAAAKPVASELLAAARAAGASPPKPIASVIVWLPGFPLIPARAPCTTLPGCVAS